MMDTLLEIIRRRRKALMQADNDISAEFERLRDECLARGEAPPIIMHNLDGTKLILLTGVPCAPGDALSRA